MVLALTGHALSCASVLLVDDDPLHREGLRLRLSREPDFAVCGEAATVADALRRCDELRPELVLLDLGLPDGDGLSLLEESRDWAKPPQVVVLTARSDEEPVALEAMRRGAAGFVSKQRPWIELLGILRQVRAGRIYFSDNLMEKLLRRRR